MALDCALLPGTLMFGEAFGHGSGGMVSGVGAALGAFRAAAGGTVVLENIDESDLFCQRHVHLAVRDRQVTPLGTTAAVPFSARVVVTTELDLQAEVAAGRFDLGLFLELEPRHIRLLGLQQRGGDDVQALAGHFLGELSGGTASRVEFSPAALEWLRTYDWPGNVRELKSFMGRVVACRPHKSEVTELDLPLVRRLLCPSPFSGADQAYTERTRFPGLAAQRVDDESSCRHKFARRRPCKQSR
jgi:two-component system response regulator HydG